MKSSAQTSPSPPFPAPSLQGGTIWWLGAFQRRGALTCSACTGDQNPVFLQLSRSQLKSHLGFFFVFFFIAARQGPPAPLRLQPLSKIQGRDQLLKQICDLHRYHHSHHPPLSRIPFMSPTDANKVRRKPKKPKCSLSNKHGNSTTSHSCTSACCNSHPYAMGSYLHFQILIFLSWSPSGAALHH